MKRVHVVQKIGLAMLVVLGLTAAGPEQPAGPEKAVLPDITDTIRETFRVRPGGTLRVDLDLGSITVETARTNTARIEVERVVKVDSEDRAREIFDDHRVVIEQRGDGVLVQAQYEGEAGFWSKWRGASGEHLKVHVRVTVPRAYEVDFSTGAGNVQVDDLEGDVQGTTGAGNVEIGDVSGSVRVNAGAGNVEVGAVGELLRVETGAGNVKLHEVHGQLEVDTGAGNITAMVVGQPPASSHLSTGAGNVTVYLDERVGVEVEASAGVGSVHTDFPLTIESGWVGNSVQGVVGGGGPLLRLSAGMGNVSLRKR